jgi:hypothetical protein
MHLLSYLKLAESEPTSSVLFQSPWSGRRPPLLSPVVFVKGGLVVECGFPGLTTWEGGRGNMLLVLKVAGHLSQLKMCNALLCLSRAAWLSNVALQGSQRGSEGGSWI